MEGENVTGYRYTTHLYCLAVQAGFYSDAVECWIFVRRVAGSILGRVRSEDIFLRLLHTVEELIYIESQPQNAAGEHERSGIIVENV